MTRAVLETERLRLRRMGLDDLDFVATMLASPAVMRYYPQTYSREEAGAWIERQTGRYAADGFGLWLAIEKGTDGPVGQVGLVRQHVDGVDEVEVGYLIVAAQWRRGLATEAALACRDFAFRDLGRRRVVSLIRPDNVPSQGVARKMGMRPEKTTTHAGLPHLVFVAQREEDGE